MSAPIYDFTLTTLAGAPMPLADYAGKLLLIVNTASKCGFTPQYLGLQTLYEEYRDEGLVVIGCPCDQFGHQEPGSADEIADFCQKNFGVSFPLTEKLEVNGDNAHPLFKYLTHAAPGTLGTISVKWNFTKFLVSRDGTQIERFASATTPEELAVEIEKRLG